MTDQELIELKKLIILVADYYDRPLKAPVVKMMAEDLRDLDFSEVQDAFEQYRRQTKFHRFPLPGEIREIVEPQVNHKSAAEALASTIIADIKRHDIYHYPGDAAYGPAGASLVRRRGGWVRICNEFWNADSTTFRAQLRDELEANLKYTPEVVERAALNPGGIHDSIKQLAQANDLNLLLEKKAK